MSNLISPDAYQVIMSLKQSKKPRMLVVDDEPDNLDLLYRTFRREYEVLRAESGVVALEILAQQGEVAVIISDQRMPEMKGTEFLSRTTPQFPDTMRIILTGFTDIEDLVEAINSGQVYRYITKPWEPEELKQVVYRATEAYEQLKQRSEALHWAQAQTALLAQIAQIGQSLAQDEYLQRIAAACGRALSADRCILQRVKEKMLNTAGVYCLQESDVAAAQDELINNSLVQEAIETQTVQIANEKTADLPLHLVIPVLPKEPKEQVADEVLAVLSLQWQQPYPLQSYHVTLLEAVSTLVGIILCCAPPC
jgi:response regulator RpfG family c-di-GMP phosphodiesterase